MKWNKLFQRTPQADHCVACGATTPYTTQTHTHDRKHYIEGVGQLCETCGAWTERAKSALHDMQAAEILFDTALSAEEVHIATNKLLDTREAYHKILRETATHVPRVARDTIGELIR